MKIRLICIIFTALLTGASVFNQAQTRLVLPLMENPRIIIKKKKRRLEIFDGAKFVRRYKIALGFEPISDKRSEGDGKTPEGDFYIFTKNPESKFYLSLGLSYPNIEAARRGLQDKIITPEEFDAIKAAIDENRMPPQKTALGGEIYIHGGGIEKDWTNGCVALRDEDMKEIFDAVEVSTRIEILP